VIVLSYPRKGDRKQFPMVRVTKGTGVQEWTKGWTALLDYGGDTRCWCDECGRRFTAHGHASLCRQCRRRQEAEQQAEATLRAAEGTVNSERDALMKPWRLRETVRPTEGNAPVVEIDESDIPF